MKLAFKVNRLLWIFSEYIWRSDKISKYLQHDLSRLVQEDLWKSLSLAIKETGSVNKTFPWEIFQAQISPVKFFNI